MLLNFARACELMSIMFFFCGVWMNQRPETGWESAQKNILSGYINTELKFVSMLNIHAQPVLHWTLFKSCIYKTSLRWSRSLQPPDKMAKWPYVTTLCVPSPFFLCHLASNEHLNGCLLPSKRTQICVPVCFKHLLRPHLAESALCWTAMWFPCPRVASYRKMQREQMLERH